MPASSALLYVSNLPWTIADQELARLLQQFADVVRARVVYDRKTGRSMGYGFVEVASPGQAAAACAALRGATLNGRPLEVKLARPARSGDGAEGGDAEPGASPGP